MEDVLFTDFTIGELRLKNRMVMAPMTRCRASAAGVPSPLAPTYYSQRAGAGLIITEASQVSPHGVGYINTPGIYSAEMVEAWKKVTEKVHLSDSLIFLQLWHVGRTSHPDFHQGELPVAPSAIGYDGEVYTHEGKKKIVTPRALERDEISQIVEQFANAARNAKIAGFDGVEIHGANGYLLDQFLRDGSNQREDDYGGSIKNRSRFPLEVVQAVVSEMGPFKVGYRINPLNLNPFGMIDSNPKDTFSHLVTRLNELDLAYLHVLEPLPGHNFLPPEPFERLTPHFRNLFAGSLIVNGGYTKELANKIISEDGADLVAFGVPFLANPDLPLRFSLGSPLNEPDPLTFYQGDEKGYIDYPTLAVREVSENVHQ